MDKVKVELEYELRDRNGKLVKRKTIKPHSWVTNFAKLCFILLTAGSENLTNTNGETVGIVNSDLPNCTCLAGEGDDTYGIVVGVSSVEALPGNYNLAEKIFHGTADGQLYHFATVTLAVEVNVDTKTTRFGFSRDFKNEGSVDVSIQEVGLICAIGGNRFLLFRHVLASPVTVPAGATVTWKVWFKIVT